MKSNQGASSIRAVVKKIITNGRHGPYAVALPGDTRLGSITFSLDPEVWEEEVWPEPGTEVLFSEIIKKVSGWRALNARFVRIEDEQEAISDEQLEKSMEKPMKRKVNSLIKRWKEEYFSRKTRETWKEWVNFNTPSRRDLEDLINDTTMFEGIRAIALYILLVPKSAWVQFDWKQRHELDSFHGYLSHKHGIDFEKLSPKMLKFLAETLALFYMFAKSDNDFLNIADVYNSMIIELLVYLPEDSDEAKILFNLYELNDFRASSNSEASSGYSPLSWLLNEEGVPEKWLRSAHERMSKIILDEIEGRALPRVEHENAFKLYFDHVVFSLRLREEKYNAQFFADQMRFLIETALDKDISNIFLYSYDVEKVLAHISDVDDEENSLSAMISRFVLREKKVEDLFSFTVAESSVVAARMMAEILNDDKKLSEKLAAMIESHEKFVKSKEVSTRERESVGNAILAKMKA